MLVSYSLVKVMDCQTDAIGKAIRPFFVSGHIYAVLTSTHTGSNCHWINTVLYRCQLGVHAVVALCYIPYATLP